MLTTLILSGFLISTFLLVVAKRITSLTHAFRLQSMFLFLYTLYMAVLQKHIELFVVCVLIFIIKVIIIPFVILRIMRKINVEESLGLLINPQLSLFIASLLTYMSYIFAYKIMCLGKTVELAAFVISISTICIGSFIMVARMKALTQIIGLLVMENGIFLAASAIIGGMPFFVEIALFFDIFVFVIIIEIFVYKVNRLFTHIDTSRMKSLKG